MQGAADPGTRSSAMLTAKEAAFSCWASLGIVWDAETGREAWPPRQYYTAGEILHSGGVRPSSGRSRFRWPSSAADLPAACAPADRESRVKALRSRRVP